MKLFISIILSLILFTGCTAGGSQQPADPQKPSLIAVFIDAGDADSHLVISPEGSALLIDTGTTASYTAIEATLKQYGITELEALLLTHPHSDHIGSAAAVLRNYPVKTVYAIEHDEQSDEVTALNAALKELGITPKLALRGDSFTLGSAKAEFLAPLPGAQFKEENDESAVLRVTYMDSTLLYMGDVEKTAEKALLKLDEDILRADLIKIGHHGDDDASSKKFLDAVSPKYAVITGDSAVDPDHVNEKTIKKLKERGIEYHVTGKEGTITFIADEDGVHMAR